MNYGYDVAGNLVNYDGVTRTYNEANQMTNDGTNSLTYDNNGNLNDDGIAYTWDRANRLKVHNGHTYTYDGLGNRVQEIVADGLPKIYDYLNDVAGGLTKLLAETHNSDVTRYVHAPRGIHAIEQVSGDWLYYVQDGLGSVRGAIDEAGAVYRSSSFAPYGELADGTLAGTIGSAFGFTGEQTNASGQMFLRARYYEPALGIFSALDPWEGISNRPMSLNGYSWVERNVPNMVDPSGMFNWDTRTIEAGDWLWCIARQGTSGWVGNQPPSNVEVSNTYIQIRNANIWIDNPNRIQPGWNLNIPEEIRQIGLMNQHKPCKSQPNSIAENARQFNITFPSIRINTGCVENIACGALVNSGNLEAAEILGCNLASDYRISETNFGVWNPQNYPVPIEINSFGCQIQFGATPATGELGYGLGIQYHAVLMFTDAWNNTTKYDGAGIGGNAFGCCLGARVSGGQGSIELENYLASSNRLPLVMLEAGATTCEKKSCLDRLVNEIDGRNFNYNALRQNSNSVARTFIERCGISFTDGLPYSEAFPAWNRILPVE